MLYEMPCHACDRKSCLKILDEMDEDLVDNRKHVAAMEIEI